MPQQKDIVKIAIQMPGAYPQLIQLDQKKPLTAVIKEVCDRWNLPGPENYALQYADGAHTYITESNRLDIKNGSILRLTKAPGRCADDLFKGIQSSDSDVRCESLKQLAAISTDITFAQEFISRDGHSLLVHIVEDANEAPLIMTHTLTAFMELMDHGIVSWENLSSVFIKKIAGFVNAKVMDTSIQQVSLDILESMVLSSISLFHQIREEITLERLIAHLQVSNQQLQTKAMALLMALLQTAGEADRQDLFAFLEKKNLRQYIHKNIIHSSGPIGDEMAHYLYVLQSVCLNHLEARMRTALDSFNQEQREALHSLRQAVFETESDGSLSNERRRSLCAKEFKKLGFSNKGNPGQDLSRTPPGLLALDTMTYFASRYPDAYSRFVLENSSREDKHECPFARSSIQLTLMLCEILRIGEPPSETGSNYHPIFFAQDRLLEELFCICIQLLNKTWKEMRATQEDFDKVMQVVREQITRTLSSKPTSLELFKNKVNALNYSEILKLRQTERLHQEETLAPPVLELKERLKPELLELIRQQRLNRLCHGTLFRKISSRRRQDKLWYCRLSPNHKVLHYGDVEEETEMPSIESLQDKIPVADIKALLIGKDCPHMKDNKGKQTKEMLDLAFSITYDVEEYSLNFVASSRTDFCLWTDGLNVLLGKEMSSESMRSELEILLSMEIKLRLLDLENVPIPDSAPPIPKPPSNFNFCYDFSQAEH
ncbi:hypothetical protein PHYPO_G00227040 [Pangasianodon hypophthalmus]|uniref:ELMO domain-containing protein n=2 Tax=Pangasianodon hypophthalmus TaxID=310915 RepID=A0A5N5NWC6_PANHP|nr:engulfment and cell motility protein 3 isoform X1 [Pangasianodon hypophthalmus]KAB5571612.1 hypothetical protein PHYPO_G00227040 [Pangasianodon hypophthalmus]